MATDSTTPPGEAAPKKRLWDTVLTATPILLTVLGTLLASRSSSEMTQAQYYRSLAAQNQSKAGDQWSFFQAKRIRGTIQQMFSERGGFRPAGALAVTNRLPKTLERTGGEAKALLDAIDAAQKSNGVGAGTEPADVEALKKAVEKYQADLPTAVQKAKESRAALAKILSLTSAAAETARERAVPAENLVFLTSPRLPAPASESKERPRDVMDATLDAQVLEVLQAIRAEKPEAEVNQLVRTLDEKKVRQAIDAAEAKSVQFDKSTDPATNAVRDLEKALQNQEALVRPVQADAEDIQMAAADLAAGDGKLSEVRKAADALQAAVARLATDTGTVFNRFKAARCDYDLRRYDREARFNQEIAGLYELQVRKAALTSDVHRERSTFFLYGMLAAQAGVTIATFGLAVRHKSILWALATAAGVTALTIGIFAFQFI